MKEKENFYLVPKKFLQIRKTFCERHSRVHLYLLTPPQSQVIKHINIQQSTQHTKYIRNFIKKKSLKLFFRRVIGKQISYIKMMTNLKWSSTHLPNVMKVIAIVLRKGTPTSTGDALSVP